MMDTSVKVEQRQENLSCSPDRPAKIASNESQASTYGSIKCIEIADASVAAGYARSGLSGVE